MTFIFPYIVLTQVNAGSNVVYFGHGLKDEMCNFFVWWWWDPEKSREEQEKIDCYQNVQQSWEDFSQDKLF